MSLLELLDKHESGTNLMNGVVIGIVTNNQDPDGLNRVKVKFPWLSEENESNWARVLSPMAGKDRGTYFLPEVDDEVLLAFEYGNIDMPYVIGSLWNGKDTPPFKNDDGKNNVRAIKSRSGSIIQFDDTDGEEKIVIADKTGKNIITIDSKENTISIQSDKDVKISSPNGKLVIDAKDMEIKASASIKIEAGSSFDGKASGQMNLKGATINLN